MGRREQAGCRKRRTGVRAPERDGGSTRGAPDEVDRRHAVLAGLKAPVPRGLIIITPVYAWNGIARKTPPSLTFVVNGYRARTATHFHDPLGW